MSLTPAMFNIFAEKHLVQDNAARLATKDLTAAWVMFYGSTTGKIKLFAYLASLEGITKMPSFFQGVSLKIKDTAVQDTGRVAEVNEPVVEVNTEPVTEVNAPGLSAFEIELLRLKAMKLQMQAEREAKEQKEKEEREAKEQKEKEEREAKEQKEKEEREAKEQKEKEYAAAVAEKDRLAREASKAALLATRIQFEQECKRQEIEQAERFKSMDIGLAKELKQLDLEDAERNREFLARENNKNRAFHAVTKYNKWLDPEVFGSPAKQFITRDSLMRLMEFNVWDSTGDSFEAPMRAVAKSVEEKCETVPVVIGGSTNEEKCLAIPEAIKIVESVSSGDVGELPAGTQEMLVKRLKEIPEVATRDENRHIDIEIDWLARNQEAEVRSMPKQKYIRMTNKSVSREDGLYVKCDCCDVMMKLDGAGCARGHDLPKSMGGSWARSNIRLICSTCNNNMGSTHTIRSYKVDMMLEKRSGESMPDTEAQTLQVEAKSDESPVTDTPTEYVHQLV